jgi:O-acetyl-ADP-ribose deacetylase (regulator of RNase III)
MTLTVLVGDVLDAVADVLIATANPWLQMTGGVNLAIILRPRRSRVRPEGSRSLSPGRSTDCNGLEPQL